MIGCLDQRINDAAAIAHSDPFCHIANAARKLAAQSLTAIPVFPSTLLDSEKSQSGTDFEKTIARLDLERLSVREFRAKVPNRESLPGTEPSNHLITRSGTRALERLAS